MSRRLADLILDSVRIGALLTVILSLGVYARADGGASGTRPPGPPIYVALGDSFSGGWALDDPALQSWPAVLATRYLHTPHFVNLTTTGVEMGFPLAEAWVPQVLAAHPTLITVWVGLHDLLGGMPAAQADTQLEALLARLQQAHARVVVITYPDPSMLPYFAALPYLAPALRAYNQAIPAVAARAHATVVDLAAHGTTWWGQPGFSFAADGDSLARPTAAGSAALARLVFAAIQGRAAR